ncbi:MAG: glutamate synthase subunit beta [Acidimicrobiales bacterium]
MGELGGFLRHPRVGPTRRPVNLRLSDWREVYEPFEPDRLRIQAGRCMDCGIPFCHHACPLGNLIPDWNDLVYRDDWDLAMSRLHATNNFPEFTGRLCPAPCEAGCVLGINSEAVTIKQVELEIVERAWSEGRVVPAVIPTATNRSVAVVGSGPAGLAAAQQLTRAGHLVVVFERAERAGGLLRYGIPEFKMEKAVLDRRLAQMAAEGTEFRCGIEVGGPGPNDPSGADLRRDFDAVVLAGGATLPRDLPIPGRDLSGIHYAMEYLKPSNQVREGTLAETPISAEGKHVVIIGGGDTGADCLGTAHRQKAASVHQLEIMPQPPTQRGEADPWPTWPNIFRTSSAHEEGGERLYAVTTAAFIDDGSGTVRALRGHQVEMVNLDGRPSFEAVEGSEFELECELVLLAMGFTGPQQSGLIEELGVELDGRGNVARNSAWATSLEDVFVCGDMGRGQSLIVWAIAEGRSAAAAVDHYLTGENVLLPALEPTRVGLR